MSGEGLRKRQPATLAALANPGNGLDPSWTVPTLAGTFPGGVWLRSFTGLLTTDATIANRIPRLYALVGGNVEFAGAAGSIILASQSLVRVSWNAGSPSGVGGNNDQVLSMPPDIFLPYGAVVELVTVGLDAGDSWHSVTVGYELVC